MWLVAAAAFFCATAIFVVARGLLAAPTTDYNEQYRMARYLLHGTGFVCPVGPERHDPSSWYSPGYIAFMAAVMRVFGEDTGASRAVIRLFDLLAAALAVGLLFELARRRLGSAVAWSAAALCLTNPLLLSKADEIWDTSFCMLGGALLLYLFEIGRPRRTGPLLAAGAACGAVAMVNPAFTLCYPLWVVLNWVSLRRPGDGLRSLVRHAAPVLAAFVLVILPWTVRNVRAFGELFYLRGNLPLEIWVGNSPGANGAMRSADGRMIHPVFDPGEAARMVSLGEYGYFRACRAEVRQWWSTDKKRFALLALHRVKWFWLGRYLGGETPPVHWEKFWASTLPGVLALIGAGILLARRRALALVAALAVFPLTYYVTVFLPRYVVPLEPFVLTAAAVVVARPFERPFEKPFEKPRWRSPDAAPGA